MQRWPPVMRVVADPGAGPGAGPGADGARLADRERLVDLAVAVVVEAVAALGGVLDVLERRRVRADPAARVPCTGGHAGADALGAAGDRRRPAGCRRRCRCSRCPGRRRSRRRRWSSGRRSRSRGRSDRGRRSRAGKRPACRRRSCRWPVANGIRSRRRRSRRSSSGRSSKSKPSSTMPLQSLSRPSQTSTPPLVFTHSQPLLVGRRVDLVGVEEAGEAGRLARAVLRRRIGVGPMHGLKQVPQFERSVMSLGRVVVAESRCRRRFHRSLPAQPPLPPTACAAATGRRAGVPPGPATARPGCRRSRRPRRRVSASGRHHVRCPKS